jgi:ribosomal protein S18 acetylase RimI-like enzyme
VAQPHTPAAAAGVTRIRGATQSDLHAVLALWRRAAALPTVGETTESLARLIVRDPGALLVAEADGRLIGAVIAAWNGWRGSFYRLTVEPSMRRRGVATLLVRDGERRLRELGALRVDAIVDSGDQVARAAWRALGYERQSSRGRFVRNFTPG